MGILNSKKLEEAKRIILSHSADELQEWIDSYYQRIALAEQEDDLIQPAAIPQMVIGKLNGVPRSEDIPIQKAIAAKPVRANKVRTKAKATADSW